MLGGVPSPFSTFLLRVFTVGVSHGGFPLVVWHGEAAEAFAVAYRASAAGVWREQGQPLGLHLLGKQHPH